MVPGRGAGMASSCADPGHWPRQGEMQTGGGSRQSRLTWRLRGDDAGRLASPARVAWPVLPAPPLPRVAEAALYDKLARPAGGSAAVVRLAMAVHAVSPAPAAAAARVCLVRPDAARTDRDGAARPRDAAMRSCLGRGGESANVRSVKLMDRGGMGRGVVPVRDWN